MFKETVAGIQCDLGFRIRNVDRSRIRYEEDAASITLLLEVSVDDEIYEIGWPPELIWDSGERVSTEDRDRIRANIDAAYRATGRRPIFDPQGVQP